MKTALDKGNAMKRKTKDRFAELRMKAEQLIEQNSPENRQLSQEQLANIIHSLHVHQIELEMQNDELRETQEALERSRDRHFQLFNQAPVGYVTVDDAGIILQANQAIADLLQLQPSVLKNKPFVHFVQERDKSLFYRCFKAFFTKSGGKNVEIRMRRSSGEEVHVSLSGQPAKNILGGGQSQDVLIVVSDISERKKAEDALLESRKRLNDIIEDIPAAICRFGPTGVISFVNREYCAFFERGEREILGKNFFEFIPEEKKAFVRKLFSTLTPGSPVKTYDNQVLSETGECRWRRWTNRAIFTEAGDVRVFQSIGYDITEQIQMEREIREKEKLKGIIELAGAICHELSQPMQILSGLSELVMMESPDGGQSAERIGKIKQQIERMEGLTRKLNTITRYDTKDYGKNDKILDLDNTSDRRAQQRFMPQKPTTIYSRKDTSLEGELIDLSRDGLSFWSGHRGAGQNGLLQLDINIEEEDFSLADLPCMVVSNMDETEGETPLRSGRRRYRVRFGDLTSEQQGQIQYFISNYTTP